MLGNPLNFSGGARSSAPTPSNTSTFKTVTLFSKKKVTPPKSKAATVASADEELAKWYSPDRRIFWPEGFIIPKAFNKFGANCGPEAIWFKTEALLLDGNTLNYFRKNIPINLVVAVIAEIVLVSGAEYYRIINGLDLEDKLHPG
ncbi:hypothetical protein J1N35_024756 [Gossypium stocksii]|uniref:Chlorophyll a-b binding protein, chloroplastic n=1 Tax=Gossypium stocksii TaxID=47602 RepID=A0A9D3V6A9_9ROSI|nr:hypothetical protein J1N35_024756 [Gossypium stocksii]